MNYSNREQSLISPSTCFSNVTTSLSPLTVAGSILLSPLHVPILLTQKAKVQAETTTKKMGGQHSGEDSFLGGKPGPGNRCERSVWPHWGSNTFVPTSQNRGYWKERGAPTSLRPETKCMENQSLHSLARGYVTENIIQGRRHF